MFYCLFRSALSSLCALCFASALYARDMVVTYDIYLGAAKLGALTLASTEVGANYAVNGQFTSTGLLGAFVQLKYVASAKGRIRNGNLLPRSYREDMNTSRRKSQVELRYDSGVPMVLTYAPDSPLTLELSAQKNTLDPLSALHALSRETDAPCTLNLTLFDGRRRSQVVTQKTGETCAGRYTRLAGFTEKEMSNRQVFDFILTYAEHRSGVWALDGAQVETFFGPARLVRR